MGVTSESRSWARVAPRRPAECGVRAGVGVSMAGGGHVHVAFSPGGVQLAVGEERGGVDLWDVRAGTKRKLSVNEGMDWSTTSCVAFDPTGKWLATGHQWDGDGRTEGGVTLWDWDA